MDDNIRMILHHLMTDRPNRAKAQQAMMYGHTTKKMTSKQFASYLQADGLKKATNLELYTLLVLFYESSNEETYNPTRYFSEDEIQQLQNKRSYQLHRFDILSKLHEDEYLSVMNWTDALRLIKKMMDCQRSVHFKDYNLLYQYGASSPDMINAIKKQFQNDSYSPPMLGINIVPNEFEMQIECNEVDIPLEAPACRIILSEDLRAAIESIEDIDDFVKRLNSKRLIPICITNFTATKLGIRYSSN